MSGDLLPFLRLTQARLAESFRGEGIRAEGIRRTLALDAAYSADTAYACAVLYDVDGGRVLGRWRRSSAVFFPYVPGYLYAREAPPLLRLVAGVDEGYDALLVDAHGRLHPRRAGLATVLGVLLGKPTIGLAKSLLVGSVRGEGEVSPVTLKGEVTGYRVRAGGPAYYVSQGNMISLAEALEFLKRRGLGYPEEMRAVDGETKAFKAGRRSAGRP
ncbi:MAG: endonuclease V [Nitrososphaerota archaeon]|nr:endonuclease V [Nitrososphaerota archaeon]